MYTCVFVGINHLEFWVELLGEIDSKNAGTCGKAFLNQGGPDNKALFAERKYCTPEGIVVDVYVTGWGGAVS